MSSVQYDDWGTTDFGPRTSDYFELPKKFRLQIISSVQTTTCSSTQAGSHGIYGPFHSKNQTFLYMRTNKNRRPDDISSPYTRRSFIQTAVGGAIALGLAGCDQVEDGLETYDGPEINVSDFLTDNVKYYDTTIDSRTLFPHSAIVNGATSGITDPISIAFRLQYLIDQNDSAAVEAILDKLIEAQDNTVTFINYRGMLPNLDFANNSTGFERSDPTFRIPDNAVLSARVAMASSAFAGTNVETKAATFLGNQKEGYNFYLGTGDPLRFPLSGNALNDAADGEQVSYFFNGYYAELAFVLSYFIGDSATISDPQAGLDAWQALTTGDAVPTSQHNDSFSQLITVPVPLSKNGSGFQYFQSLLALPTASVSAGLSNALYNALYSFLDAGRRDNVPGIYSGGPDSQGIFLTDNGLDRLTAPGSPSVVRESIVTVDALASALRLFPEDSAESQTLRRWIGVYNDTPGVQGANGLFGSVDKSGNVAQSIFARQNAAMILVNSTAPDHLENFLTANAKTTLADMLSSVSFSVNASSLSRISEVLPNPPLPVQTSTI